MNAVMKGELMQLDIVDLDIAFFDGADVGGGRHRRLSSKPHGFDIACGRLRLPRLMAAIGLMAARSHIRHAFEPVRLGILGL